MGLLVACMVAGMLYTQARDRHALETRGVRTEAEVVRVEHEDRNARHLWLEPRIASYPVFRFTTADGSAVEFRSIDMVDATRVVPGQRMPVVYDPLDPRLARDAASFDGHRAWPDLLWPIPFLLMGIALVVIALLRPGRMRPP
ncbi:DUF3592 domain-containing protein [Roseomonas sp. PWR1]|uniref:DUF3592 domain-containing protein n=1 Tax=Roseomonas nitratireducens TaxID=2820810 RepID=A0ABS4ASF2_9PROT|nr:DUF3592 domain-containing protein [Neoroseomonas nitratireducens]